MFRGLGVLVVAAGWVAVSAQAGAPLWSEDAGVLAPRECEVEAALATATASGVTARGRALAVACGVGASGQAGLGIDHASASGASANGLALAGKWRLWQGEGDAALVLAPTLGWADEGSGWQRAGEEIKLAYSGPLAADWTLHLNLAHTRDRLADERGTGVSVALEHGGWNWGGIVVAPMADLAFDDRNAPWWNVALRMTLVAERVWLGVGHARQIDSQRARETVLSLKLAF